MKRREAGCVHFIDRARETFDRDRRELYRAGLAAARKKRSELFPKSQSLPELEAAQMIVLLRAIEQSEFFKLLRTHVIMGFLAMPEWGDNRRMAGAHIGR